jgi:hypothetical protein
LEALADICFADPAVDALAQPLREQIAASWYARAKSELQVGHAFDAMVPRLIACNAHATVVEMLVRSAAQERVHADLCLRLAERYGACTLSLPDIGEVTLPNFGFADIELELAVLVAGMCCINETIATAWLTASIACATTPLALAANRYHLREEVEHARLGWAHLASSAVSSTTRAALGQHLPALLQANLPGWERDNVFIPTEGVPGHGHLSSAASKQVARDAIGDLVLPGFAHVGIDINAAEAWRTEQAW